MSNMGMVKGTLDIKTGAFTNITLKLISTEKDNKNKTVRTNSKDLFRAQEIYTNVHDFFSDVQVICIEMPVGSQSSNAMKSYGMCIMLSASFTVPLIEVTASEVKKAATGSISASKKDMINWATGCYPDLNWLKQSNRIIAKNEHLADALASVHAGVNTQQFQLLTSIWKS